MDILITNIFFVNKISLLIYEKPTQNAAMDSDDCSGKGTVPEQSSRRCPSSSQILAEKNYRYLALYLFGFCILTAPYPGRHTQSGNIAIFIRKLFPALFLLPKEV
jgi:hypothetical protein